MKKQGEITIDPGTPKAVRLSYETFSWAVEQGILDKAYLVSVVERARSGHVLSSEDEDSLQMLVTLFGDALDSGDADAAWRELLRVIRLAGLVFTAMRVKRGGRRANERLHGTDKEKAAARALYQRVVDELCKQDPTRSYKLILSLAARKVRSPTGQSVSPLTIKHYVRNPKKK